MKLIRTLFQIIVFLLILVVFSHPVRALTDNSFVLPAADADSRCRFLLGEEGFEIRKGSDESKDEGEEGQERHREQDTGHTYRTQAERRAHPVWSVPHNRLRRTERSG